MIDTKHVTTQGAHKVGGQLLIHFITYALIYSRALICSNILILEYITKGQVCIITNW